MSGNYEQPCTCLLESIGFGKSAIRDAGYRSNRQVSVQFVQLHEDLFVKVDKSHITHIQKLIERVQFKLILLLIDVVEDGKRPIKLLNVSHVELRADNKTDRHT